MSKIVIGTANFYQKYGFDNQKISNQNLNLISKFAKKKNIKILDTALNYNISKNVTKKFNFSNFKIITKIKLPQNNENQFLKNIKKKLNLNLKLLKVKNYEYILLHNPTDLKSKYGKNLIELIKYFKKKKITNKIGVSIYDPKELNLVFKNFKPDLIQVPINIFDHRFIDSKYYNLLKKKKIKIQARSIFLQGLLVKDKKNLYKFKNYKKIKKHLKNFEKWCQNENISKLEACVHYVKNFKNIDLITVGLNSIKELKEIFKIFESKKKINLKKFIVSDNKLIDPRKW